MNCFRVIILFTFLLGAMLTPPCGAATVSEAEVKFAFLIDIATFTEWPESKFPSSSAPIIIGVLGDESLYRNFSSQLRSYEESKHEPLVVRGRQVLIKFFSTALQARSAELLWISSQRGEALSEYIDTLRGASVLTVSDRERFTHLGGIIEWFISDRNSHFRVNNSGAQSEKIQISSAVLKIADSVE